MQETPFNPVISPNLQIPMNETQTAKEETKPTPRKRVLRRTSHKPRVRRVIDPKASAIRFTRRVSRKAKTSWKRIKGGLQTRLARLDAGQLKRVLVACGVAATAAVVILALAKHTALIVVILAVLGALVLLKLWNRILTLDL